MTAWRPLKVRLRIRWRRRQAHAEADGSGGQPSPLQKCSLILERQPLKCAQLACQPESRPEGERRLVSRSSASWNQLNGWLWHLDALRRAP